VTDREPDIVAVSVEEHDRLVLDADVGQQIRPLPQTTKSIPFEMLHEEANPKFAQIVDDRGVSCGVVPTFIHPIRDEHTVCGETAVVSPVMDTPLLDRAVEQAVKASRPPVNYDYVKPVVTGSLYTPRQAPMLSEHIQRLLDKEMMAPEGSSPNCDFMVDAGRVDRLTKLLDLTKAREAELNLVFKVPMGSHPYGVRCTDYFVYAPHLNNEIVRRAAKSVNGPTRAAEPGALAEYTYSDAVGGKASAKLGRPSKLPLIVWAGFGWGKSKLLVDLVNSGIRVFDTDSVNITEDPHGRVAPVGEKTIDVKWLQQIAFDPDDGAPRVVLTNLPLEDLINCVGVLVALQPFGLSRPWETVYSRTVRILSKRPSHDYKCEYDAKQRALYSIHQYLGFNAIGGCALSDSQVVDYSGSGVFPQDLPFSVLANGFGTYYVQPMITISLVSRVNVSIGVRRAPVGNGNAGGDDARSRTVVSFISDFSDDVVSEAGTAAVSDLKLVTAGNSSYNPMSMMCTRPGQTSYYAAQRGLARVMVVVYNGCLTRTNKGALVVERGSVTLTQPTRTSLQQDVVPKSDNKLLVERVTTENVQWRDGEVKGTPVVFCEFVGERLVELLRVLNGVSYVMMKDYSTEACDQAMAKGAWIVTSGAGALAVSRSYTCLVVSGLKRSTVRHAMIADKDLNYLPEWLSGLTNDQPRERTQVVQIKFEEKADYTTRIASAQAYFLAWYLILCKIHPMCWQASGATTTNSRSAVFVPDGQASYDADLRGAPCFKSAKQWLLAHDWSTTKAWPYDRPSSAPVKGDRRRGRDEGREPSWW